MSNSNTDYADSDGFNQYRPLTQRRIREHGERLLKALAQVDLIPSFDDIEIRDDAEINFGPQPGQLDTSSLFVYLLTLTTQVIRIEVTDPYWRLHHRCLNAFGRLAQLQGVTSPAPLFLERLQTVRVKRIWHDQPPIVPIFIFFRSWTSVKSLVAGELRRPYSYTSRDWPVSQAFCEELAFENSFVVPEPVEDLIRGVALRSFKCELTVDENGGGKYIRDVLGVLERHVASTLEELTLLGGDYTHSTVLYRIGSLKGFVCLKKLVIDLGCYCSDTTSIGVEWDDDHTSRGKDNLELLRRNRVASFIDFLTILPECIESLDAIIMYSQPRPLEWDHRIRCGPEESGPSKDFNGEAMREALDKERTNRLTKLRSVRLMDGDRFDCRWPADINEEKAASAWVTM